MPPLLCPSPNIVDQTFPRSVDELQLVEKALVTISDLIQQSKCLLVLTPPLSQFIVQLEQDFDWSKTADYPRLQLIYALLAQLGLQQAGVVSIDVSKVEDYSPHPLPMQCTATALGASWADEVGRLLVEHNGRTEQGKHFAAVACTFAFAGRPLGTYENPKKLPTFPLIGPADVGTLEDSMEWDLPDDLHLKTVTFQDAYKRIALLGGHVEEADATSHYQVRFKGGRPWPLDKNHREIKDQFIKELVPITGQTFECIKYVLIYGEWPPRKFRLS